MATINSITTGEQTVTTTGAVTGTLDTSAITGNYSFRLRVRNLTAGKKLVIALEDTANATPFQDALQIAVWHIEGTLQSGTGILAAATESCVEKELAWYDIPYALLGGTNNKLRVNVLRITGGTTCKIQAWLNT